MYITNVLPELVTFTSQWEEHAETKEIPNPKNEGIEEYGTQEKVGDNENIQMKM